MRSLMGLGIGQTGLPASDDNSHISINVKADPDDFGIGLFCVSLFEIAQDVLMLTKRWWPAVDLCFIGAVN